MASIEYSTQYGPASYNPETGMWQQSVSTVDQNGKSVGSAQTYTSTTYSGLPGNAPDYDLDNKGAKIGGRIGKAVGLQVGKRGGPIGSAVGGLIGKQVGKGTGYIAGTIADPVGRTIGRSKGSFSEYMGWSDPFEMDANDSFDRDVVSMTPEQFEDEWNSPHSGLPGTPAGNIQHADEFADLTSSGSTDTSVSEAEAMDALAEFAEAISEMSVENFEDEWNAEALGSPSSGSPHAEEFAGPGGPNSQASGKSGAPTAPSAPASPFGISPGTNPGSLMGNTGRDTLGPSPSSISSPTQYNSHAAAIETAAKSASPEIYSPDLGAAFRTDTPGSPTYGKAPSVESFTPGNAPSSDNLYGRDAPQSSTAKDTPGSKQDMAEVYSYWNMDTPDDMLDVNQDDFAGAMSLGWEAAFGTGPDVGEQSGNNNSQGSVGSPNNDDAYSFSPADIENDSGGLYQEAGNSAVYGGRTSKSSQNKSNASAGGSPGPFTYHEDPYTGVVYNNEGFDNRGLYDRANDTTSGYYTGGQTGDGTGGGTGGIGGGMGIGQGGEGMGGTGRSNDGPDGGITPADLDILDDYDSGDGECFSGDTLILMADGTEKPIMDVHAGEQVASFTKLGELKSQTVLENLITGRRRLINIDGVKATPPHPFLCSNGKWIFAREIEPGLELVKSDGSTNMVKNVYPDGHASKVYNLEVDGGDCFIAGGFRVHNSTIICAELHRQGWLTDEEWDIERRYSRLENPFRGLGDNWDSVSHTYRCIAKPLIALSRQAPMSFGRMLAAAIRPWITELGFRYGGKPHGHILGHLAMDYGSPLVRLLWGIKAKPLQTATT